MGREALHLPNTPILHRSNTPPSSRSAFTLLEVMLAMLILGMCMTVLLTGVSQCLQVARMARIFDTTRELLTRVEVEHPIEIVEDIKDAADSGTFDDPKLAEYAWRRDLEPVGDEKYGLFKVTTTISWTEQGKETSEQVVTYVYNAEAARKAGK